MVSLTCSCGQIYQLGPQHAGRRVRCKACGQIFQAPAAQPHEFLVANPPALAQPTLSSAATLQPLSQPGLPNPFPPQTPAWNNAGPINPAFPVAGNLPLEPFPLSPLPGAFPANGLQPASYPPFHAPTVHPAADFWRTRGIYLGAAIGLILLVTCVTFIAARWAMRRAESIVGSPEWSAPVLTPEAGPVPWKVTPDPRSPRPDICARPVKIPIAGETLITFVLSDSGQHVFFSRFHEGQHHVFAVDLSTGQVSGDVAVKQYGELGQVMDGSANGKTFVSMDNTQLRLWSFEDKRLVTAWFPYPGKHVYQDSIHYLGADQLVTDHAGDVIVWNLPEARRRYTLRTGRSSGYNYGRTMLASPNHRYLGLASNQGFDFYEVANGSPQGTLTAEPNFAASICEFRSDGREFLAIGAAPTDYKLLRWDMATGKLLSSAPYVGPSSVRFQKSYQQPRGSWGEYRFVSHVCWWGSRYVLCDQIWLIDLQRGKVVARCHGGFAHQPAKSPPDQRLWIRHSDYRTSTASIAALPAPEGLVEGPVAAALDGKNESWLQPGATVRLQLDFDGPGTDAQSFKEELAKSITRYYSLHGVQVSTDANLTLRITAQVSDTTAPPLGINPLDYVGRAPPPPVPAKQLSCQLELRGPQEEVLWKKSTTSSPHATAHVKGTPLATNPLDDVWMTVANTASEIPYYLPRGQGKALPLQLQFGEDGVKFLEE